MFSTASRRQTKARRQRYITEGDSLAAAKQVVDLPNIPNNRARYHTISDPHDTKHIEVGNGKAFFLYFVTRFLIALIPCVAIAVLVDLKQHRRRCRTDTYQRWLRQQRLTLDQSTSTVVLLSNIRNNMLEVR